MREQHTRDSVRARGLLMWIYASSLQLLGGTGGLREDQRTTLEEVAWLSNHVKNSVTRFVSANDWTAMVFIRSRNTMTLAGREVPFNCSTAEMSEEV